MGVFCVVKSKALEQVRRKYKAWLQEEEVTYPNHFFLQLGACAALFLVLFGLKQVQAEPVRAAIAGIRNVATMEVELGRSIGKLEFVGNFVPESVMVYWNAGEAQLSAPFEAATLLAEQEGWAVFEGTGALLSGGEGYVKSVAPCQDGYRLTIEYDNGLVGMMEPLQGVRVAANERVHLEQSVGLAMRCGQVNQVRVQVLDGDAPVSAATWLR